MRAQNLENRAPNFEMRGAHIFIFAFWFFCFGRGNRVWSRPARPSVPRPPSEAKLLASVRRGKLQIFLVRARKISRKYFENIRGGQKYFCEMAIGKFVFFQKCRWRQFGGRNEGMWGRASLAEICDFFRVSRMFFACNFAAQFFCFARAIFFVRKNRKK